MACYNRLLVGIYPYEATEATPLEWRIVLSHSLPMTCSIEALMVASE
jgi:hypothetical protein